MAIPGYIDTTEFDTNEAMRVKAADVAGIKGGGNACTLFLSGGAKLTAGESLLTIEGKINTALAPSP